MDIQTSSWYESSIGIERGPLVYALKIDDKWNEIKTDKQAHSFFEVLPEGDWNYGLIRSEIEAGNFKIIKHDRIGAMPWNLENAPLSLKISACKIPEWQLYHNSAGKIPARVRMKNDEGQKKEITLVPYGCTTLRIAQFPIVGLE